MHRPCFVRISVNIFAQISTREGSLFPQKSGQKGHTFRVIAKRFALKKAG